MKTVILAILLLCGVQSYSQNRGISNENNILKIQYLGSSNGSQVFSLENKVNCEVVVKLDKNGVFSNYTLPALGSTTILIPYTNSQQVKFKAKRESGALCKQNPDNGWVEQESLVSLPVKFGKIIASKVSEKTIKIQFESEEDISISHYDVKISYDSKIYKKIVVLFPNGVVGHKLYTAYIKL
jgi:hypothetical protein